MAEPKRPNSLVFNEAMLKGFINGTLEPAVEEKIASLLEARPDLLEKISAKSGDGFLKRLREVQQRSVEKSPAPIKAEVVATAPIKKSPTKSDSSIPEALANYAGYKIIKELGRGGMGVVYLAKNIQMDRLEVLKVLNERLLDHEGAKERFLREIRAVSKLSSTNIVTSYSILPLDNLLVFAMEYVHGIDLHQYTNKFKPLSIGLACSFAKQVAAGLEHAHEKRLVHRDIKPSNVIVYKSGGQLQLKILDFGLAKATSEEAAAGAGLTQDGTMLGTPEYMSPEQTMNAAKADIRADIYSLGCTLYYMLTGKPPFTGTHGSVLLAHSQREPTALNLLRPDVPIELAAVVSKMLAKDVRKRYQTPSEVAQSLLPFVNQTRSSVKQSVGEAAASNTVNDLNGPERETSVEAPLSELLLEADSQSLAPQPNFAAVAATMPAKRTAPQTQKSTNRTKTKPKSPKWFLPTVVALGALIFFGALWQIASFTFRTPNGTIVVENMPADAEVLVDGQKMDIAWNAGKDKAEVSINAGTHQLRVLNQGNEIYGDKVSLKGGDSTVVTLSVVKPTATDAGTAQPPTQPSVHPPTTPPTQPSVQSLTLGPTDALERKAPGRVDTDAPTEFTETPSGLKYRILRRGNGKRPTAKSDVVAHYKGWLDNQTVFDSTYRNGESSPFSLTRVIKGWTEGLPLISEGGMIELNIPPALAYAAKGTPGGPIPPNSQLHFIIELTAVNTNAAVELNLGQPSFSSSTTQSVAEPFRPLFNGNDLTGWHGSPHLDPTQWAKKSDAQKAEWNADMKLHWQVRDGVIVNNGQGVMLSTDESFGDIDLSLEYKTVARADSGIYLRGTPQVQIWDSTDVKNFDKGANLGSGGLYNNDRGSPGRDPLVHADKPFGEWNRLRVVQIGAITSVWLNDRLVVDKATMQNFWDRNQSLYQSGPIQLQTFSGETQWRNIVVRELSSTESRELLLRPSAFDFNLPQTASIKSPNATASVSNQPNDNWQSLFNGSDLNGWKGSRHWSVRDGCITGTLTASDKLQANTCLIWEGGELGDFEIEFECTVSSDGNTGLQVRSKIIDAPQFVLSGYQADIDGKANWTGALYDEKGRGILAKQGESVTFGSSGTKSVNTLGDATKLKFGISAQGWNYYRVVAKGNKIQYYVNSQLLSEVIDQDATKAAARGVLGLQLHTGKTGAQVQFKSIRLKQLSDETPLQGSHKTTDTEPVSDSFVVGTKWVGENRFLTVLTRSGEDFTAKYVLGTNEIIVAGKVRAGWLEWVATDARVISGNQGGDHVGTIARDTEGLRIDFESGSISKSRFRRTFVLRLQKQN